MLQFAKQDQIQASVFLTCLLQEYVELMDNENIATEHMPNDHIFYTADSSIMFTAVGNEDGVDLPIDAFRVRFTDGVIKNNLQALRQKEENNFDSFVGAILRQIILSEQDGGFLATVSQHASKTLGFKQIVEDFLERQCTSIPVH